MMLRNRRLRVSMGDKFSSQRFLNHGLPQGSVLAPTLFNSYTSDMLPTGSRKLLHADDFPLAAQAATFNDIESTMNQDLSTKWRLKPNPHHLNKVEATTKTTINLVQKLATTSWGASAPSVCGTSTMALVYPVAECCAAAWTRSSRHSTC